MQKTFIGILYAVVLTLAVPAASVYALKNFPAESVGIAGGPIFSIVAIPDNSNAVYVGTGSGIFKSINGEDIWAPANEGLASTYVYDIVPNTITGTILYAATKEGVSKSSDYGTKWTAAGLAEYQVYCLAVNPVTITYLAAGTPAGVFTSTDAGATWTKEATGPSNVYSIAIDPKKPLTMYAGSFGEGVYKSINFGTSWTATGSGPEFVNSIALNPSNTSVIYTATTSGLYKTTTSGTSWSSTGADFSDTPAYSIAIPASNPSIVYAATDKGVYKTTDAGTVWASMNNGILAEGQRGPFVREIAVDPRTISTLYAGTYSGSINDVNIYKSIDSASSWTQITRKLSNTIVYSLAFDPQYTNNMYAGTSTLGVLKSIDRGQLWLESNEGLTSYLVRAVGVNPSSSVVYAGTSSGLFISSDDGGEWEAASPNPAIYSLVIDPLNPTNIYTGTNKGIFISADDGATWSSLNNNLSNPYIYSIALHPAETGVLYVGTNGDGVFKSTSGGASWTPVNTGLDYLQILSLAIGPESPYAIYAGTIGGGIYRSVDDGATWQAASSDISIFTVNSIAINPSAPNIIYAGMEGKGFYRSTDYGQTWTVGAEDITDKTVYYLILDPQDTQTLFAALEGDIKSYTFNSPPYKPSAPSPSAGAIDVPVTTTLSWSGGDPDAGDSVSYKVYFGTDELFGDNSTATVTTASYAPGKLKLNQTYYWKIVAVDGHAAETEGDIWSFTTVTSNPPLKPSNPSPADGAEKLPLIVSLSWEGGDTDNSDTVTYDVYLGTQKNPPLIKKSVKETTYTTVTPLLPLATYYWKIVAHDNHGYETEGSIWTFTTKLLPEQCLAEAVLGKDAIKLDALRRLRDEVLLKSKPGRELVILYYMLSPRLISLVQQNPDLKKETVRVLEKIFPEIEQALSTKSFKLSPEALHSVYPLAAFYRNQIFHD